MLWQIFALGAAFVWAFGNILDKHIIEKHIQNPMFILVTFAHTSLIVGIISFLIFGMSNIGLDKIFLGLLSGAMYSGAVFFYYKAVKIGEVSRIVPLLYTSTFFTAIFAAFFLNEIFSALTYVGIILLFIGAVWISKERSFRIRPNKSALFALATGLFLSSYTITAKFVLESANVWELFTLHKLGAFIAFTPLIFLMRKEFAQTFKSKKTKTLGLIYGNNIITNLGGLLIILAYGAGTATLTNALSTIQPLFVLLIAMFLSRFYPVFFKEPIDIKTILHKAVAIILIISGAILTSL